MAACAITISGTSGYVLVRYTLGTNVYSVKAYLGDPVFIDDSATDVSYTTLAGDAIASSLCLTITSLPEVCYLFQWAYNTNVIQTIPYTINQVEFDSNIYPVTPCDLIDGKNMSIYNFIYEFNQLALETIYVNAYDIDSTTPGQTVISLIFKTIGTDIPKLRLVNTIAGNDLIMEGVVSGSCLPVGYTQADVYCSSPSV